MMILSFVVLCNYSAVQITQIDFQVLIRSLKVPCGLLSPLVAGPVLFTSCMRIHIPATCGIHGHTVLQQSGEKDCELPSRSMNKASIKIMIMYNLLRWELHANCL